MLREGARVQRRPTRLEGTVTQFSLDMWLAAGAHRGRLGAAQGWVENTTVPGCDRQMAIGSLETVGFFPTMRYHERQLVAIRDFLVNTEIVLQGHQQHRQS